MTTEYRVSSTGNFEAGLFDCSSDMGTFCTSWFCPCIAYGLNQQRAQNKDDYAADAAIYCLLDTFGFAACTGAWGRGNVRAVRHIEGGFATDCLVHWCCRPCALTQEKIELDMACSFAEEKKEIVDANPIAQKKMEDEKASLPTT